MLAAGISQRRKSITGVVTPALLRVRVRFAFAVDSDIMSTYMQLLSA